MYLGSFKSVKFKLFFFNLDNVALTLDGVLFLRIINAYKASYGVEDVEFAVSQLAQTTMR